MVRSKFGLEQALKVIEAKPTVTRDAVETAKAFLGAVGIKVVVQQDIKKLIGKITTLQTKIAAVVQKASARITSANVNLLKKVGAYENAREEKLAAIEDKAQEKRADVAEKATAKVEKLYVKIRETKTDASLKKTVISDKAVQKEADVKETTDNKVGKARAKNRKTVNKANGQIAQLQKAVAAQNETLKTLSKVGQLFS